MEDCERLLLLRPLSSLEKRPLDISVSVNLLRLLLVSHWSQASMGDVILNYRPTGYEEHIWKTGTRLPFDPFISSGALIDLHVECPKCGRQISTRKAMFGISRHWIRVDYADSEPAQQL